MDPTYFYSIPVNSFESKKEYKLYECVKSSNSEVVQTSEILPVPKTKLNINLGNSVFKSNYAVVMANLDALTFACKNITGSLKFVDQENVITALCIDDTTGGITEYINFRKPEAAVYGINSIGDKTVHLDDANNIDEIIVALQKNVSLGVDLIVDLSENKDNLKIATYCLNNNGTYIFKISELNIQFLYNVSEYFQNFYLIKPLSAFNEKFMFLVAKNKYNMSTLNVDMKVKSDFVKWIKEINFDNLEQIDQYKPFILWNIPDRK